LHVRFSISGYNVFDVVTKLLVLPKQIRAVDNVSRYVGIEIRELGDPESSERQSEA
jgi:hypothetical protein